MEQNQQSQPPVFNPQGQAQQPAPQYQPRVTASPMMDPVTAVKTCFKKYFNFKGRARRSEFWWFVLFDVVVSSALTFLAGLVPVISYVSLLFTLVMIIPLLSALTRRLHDVGRSAVWVVILGLFILAYYGAFAALIGSNIDMLAEATDMMGLAQVMADSVQKAPLVATVLVCSSLGTLFFVVLNVIFAVFDSKWGENKYGPSPKYR